MPFKGSSFKGFPFDEEEGRAGAWSELAARHPDLASRLRAAAWPRKRRNGEPEPDGSATAPADDFGNLDEHFNRFPFDDIPPEFRGHFQPHFSRRYGSQEAPQRPPQQPPAHQTIATQTEDPEQGPSSSTAIPLPQGSTPIPLPQGTTPIPLPQGTTPIPLPQGTTTIPLPQGAQIPQYGLRNTVDLGQKTPVEEDRSQRSMSAPPDPRTDQNPQAQGTQTTPTMSSHDQTHEGSSSNVRHIPIFVEGRDQPIINKNVDQNTQHAEGKPHPHPQPHPQTDREYFAEREVPVYHHPPNFSRAFGSPFGQGFRQGPQPYTQQKAYPQNAGFQRSGSPSQGRAQSPRPQSAQSREYVEVPVYHEPPKTPKPQPKAQQQQHYQQQQQPHHQQQQQPHHQQQQPQQQQQHPQYQQQQQQYQQQQQQKFQQEQQQQQTEQPKPQPPSANDPISKILSIQKDVLDLMTEVEKFSGKKSDKKYIYLDEMLTRNLIKLDDIETEGKENIRQARKEAIKCIQKCIAVLETKADQTPSAGGSTQEMAVDEQNSNSQPNGETQEVEMNIETKESQTQSEQGQTADQNENANVSPMETDPKPDEPKQGTEKPKKKLAKGTKKRDKSKENVQNKEEVGKDSCASPKNEKMDVEQNAEQNSAADVAANQ